jgi:hypothetical protein
MRYTNGALAVGRTENLWDRYLKCEKRKLERSGGEFLLKEAQKKWRNMDGAARQDKVRKLEKKFGEL